MNTVIAAETTYRVKVSRNLAELVMRGGYSYADPCITDKHFPVQETDGEEERELVLLHFGKGMWSEDVLGYMAKNGYRAGTIRELAALAVHYSDLQQQHPIVAFGSSAIVDEKHCPSTDIDIYARVGYLCDWDGMPVFTLPEFRPRSDWEHRCRFLAIRV